MGEKDKSKIPFYRKEEMKGRTGGKEKGKGKRRRGREKERKELGREKGR